MLTGEDALASEFLTLDSRTKEALVDLAAALLPERERLGQTWFNIFEQSAAGTGALSSDQIALVTSDLLRLFFEHVPKGDFDVYYRSVVAESAEYRSIDLPNGLLMLALHQFEQAAMPFLSQIYREQARLHVALVALDRLCDNLIVLIAFSHFESILTELRALQQVTDTALSTLDLEKLMQNLVIRMVEAAQADCGVIALCDPVTGELANAESVGLLPGMDGTQLVRDDKQITEGVVGRGETIQVVGSDNGIGSAAKGVPGRPQSMLQLPLKLGARVTGVVCIGRHEPVPFDQRSVQLLAVLGERAASAIDHAQLYRRTARLLEQTEALQRVTANITSKMSLPQVLEVVIDGAIEIFGTAAAAVYLLNGDAGELNCVARRGVSPSFVETVKGCYYQDGTVGLSAGEQFYSPDVSQDERLASLRPELNEQGLRAMLSLSFGRAVEARGALCLWHDRVRPYGPGERALGQAFADQAAIAISNATLYREIREHAAELDRVNSELQILDRMKADFLAMISHELRTPLTAILGYTDLLLRGARGDLAERQSSDLKTIRANGQRLLTLINDLIDFSSIEAGRTALTARTLQLSQAIPHAVGNYETLAEARSIRLQSDVPVDLPKVRGDAAAVEKVLGQLLSNAVKFTPHGGIVEVSAKRATQGEDACRTGARPAGMDGDASDGECVVVSVRDTGIGIPPEQMSRIWDYFYQVDSSSARRFGGTGLGLAIAKRLVELQAGTIWAESEGVPGKGSRFSFALRIA